MGGQERRIRWSVRLTIGLLAGLVVPAASAQDTGTRPATLGALAQALSEVRGAPARDAAAALQALREAGVDLPASARPETPLTEGLVVRIANRLGLRLATRNHERELSQEELDRLVQVLGSELATGKNPPEPAAQPEHHKDDHGTDPLTKGKGKKKGLRSPADP